MKHLISMGALAVLFVAAPATATGQRVTADVILRSGPVRGHVVIGDRPHDYHYDLDRRLVVHRHPVRAIRVARLHVPRGQARGWWRRHGYRPVTLYLYAGRFYDRTAFDRLHRRGLTFRRVVVWERGGRFFHDEPDRLRHDDRNRRIREVRARDSWDYDD